MITTKAWGALGLTAALMAGVAVSQADTAKPRAAKAPTSKVGAATYRAEEAPAPAPREKAATNGSLELGSAKPAGGDAAPAGHAPAACPPKSRDFCHKLWDWLTYRPVTDATKCHGTVTCQPPLFAYFLEHCPPPANGHHAGAPCADGRCAVKKSNDAVREKEESSSLLAGMFSKNTDRPAAKPAAEKPAEHRAVTHQVSATAARKPAPEMKEAAETKEAKPEVEKPAVLNGKETGKWRALPTRR